MSVMKLSRSTALGIQKPKRPLLSGMIKRKPSWRKAKLKLDFKEATHLTIVVKREKGVPGQESADFFL